MADKHGILNSWLEVFSPTVMGCLTADYTTVDLKKWGTWCRETANFGGNGVRILTYAPWAYPIPGSSVPIERLFCPYKLDMLVNQWDLDTWNDKWFSAIVKMRDIALKYNLKIWLSLFDNCQGGPTEGVVPWYNNKQGIQGYYNSFAYSYKFIDKIVALLGDTINYELINEGMPKGNMALAVKWNVAMFDRLVSHGIKEETVCWGALPEFGYSKKGVGKNGNEHFISDRPDSLGQQILSVTERRDRVQSNKVYRAMHGVGVANEVGVDSKKFPEAVGLTFPASFCGEAALEWWGGAHSGKGFVSDDGVKNGANELDRLPGGYKYQRPSEVEWYAVAKMFFQKDGGKVGKWVIERLPQNLDPAIWVPTLWAISQAYFEVYGIRPINYGKYPDIVPIPDPIIPDPITPDPLPEPVHKFTWQGIVGLVLLLAIIVTLAIIIF